MTHDKARRAVRLANRIRDKRKRGGKPRSRWSSFSRNTSKGANWRTVVPSKRPTQAELRATAELLDYAVISRVVRGHEEWAA